MIDLVFGSGGEPDEQAVEVLEDCSVLLVDRTMCFVDDDEVEVAGSKSAPAVLHLVDQAHHRGVGRDVNPTLGVSLGDQVHRDGFRQDAS